VDLALSWVAFPLVLSIICLGCGLAAESLAGVRIAGPLIPAVGFAAVVAVGQFTTLDDSTAGLTVPVVLAMAAAGIVLALLAGRRLRPPGWLLASLLAAFAVYAAPIVLSGEATVAGYIKLDDTATWLAFTDQAMANGRDLSGLAPSTHEATLAVNIGEGYPIGAFIPLGVGAELLGDPAWLIQPYMAFLAVLLALAVWALARPLVASHRIRAGVVFVAAQPALLYGYYLWGGVKELAAAALIATAAALAADAVERAAERRTLVALALVSGTLIGVLSGGGAVWLAPILLGLVLALRPRLSHHELFARSAMFAAGLAVLAIPVIAPGGLLPPTSSPLSDSDAKGNLLEPLDPLQVFGIWPAGDFRLPPTADVAVYALIALAAALAAAGTLWAWRRRARGMLCLLAAGLAGAAALALAGSPWVDAKALATASPFLLLVALLGAAALGATVRPWLGAGAGLLIAFGVLWSNALAYRDVSLAPRDQLAELEEIGDEIAGEGPTLMTEYSPYGARHFLRQGDPEAVSELRRREIPKRNGEVVRKGFAADTDEFDSAALGVYRTLVLRRSPVQSRPPGAFALTWSGDFYEVWQRPPGDASLPPHLPLGSRHDPLAVPRCADVQALARDARTLVAATRPSPVVAEVNESAFPGDPAAISAAMRAPQTGDYEVWLGGSVRPEVDVSVDGESVGEVRHELNNLGQFIGFGGVRLDAGTHRVQVEFDDADLHPGSGGSALPVGPLVLSLGDAADTRLITVPAADSRELCGRAWDWIEAG
jgi:hypothetical protein